MIARSSVPAWARRRNEERQAARDERQRPRIGSLIAADALEEPVAWAWYGDRVACLSCKPAAGNTPIRVLWNADAVCAGCGERIDREEPGSRRDHVERAV